MEGTRPSLVGAARCVRDTSVVLFGALSDVPQKIQLLARPSLGSVSLPDLLILKQPNLHARSRVVRAVAVRATEVARQCHSTGSSACNRRACGEGHDPSGFPVVGFGPWRRGVAAASRDTAAHHAHSGRSGTPLIDGLHPSTPHFYPPRRAPTWHPHSANGQSTLQLHCNVLRVQRYNVPPSPHRRRPRDRTTCALSVCAQVAVCWAGLNGRLGKPVRGFRLLTVV